MRPSTPIALTLLALAACGEGPAEGPDATGAPRATWYQDVAPIVAEHCMGCHQPGGIAPFSLTEYDDAREVASLMLYAVENRIMPPWDAWDGDECAPRFGFKNDPRLSDEEIELLRWWVDDGTPAGEVADVPAPPTTTLSGVTHSTTPAVPYVTSGTADEFICYVLDPGVTQLGWMNGAQLTPGNPKVVHHAVTSVIPPGPALDALVAERGVGVPFDCANGMPTPEGAYLINVWTPGQDPMTTPAEIALPLQAGAALITQFHYHPGGIANAPDASRIDLRLTSTVPEKMFVIGAWGNAFAAPELLPGPNDPGGTPAFYIPADVPDHREHMRFQVVADTNERFPLFFAYPHMHYIGVELAVSIERATMLPGEPADECLINVPRWDFDWQRTYQYDAAVDQLPTVGSGDIIDIRCSYDNTLANPFVQRALEELGLTDPIDVVLGEESLDEMCLGIFGIAFDVPTGARYRPPGLRLVPIATSATR